MYKFLFFRASASLGSISVVVSLLVLSSCSSTTLSGNANAAGVARSCSDLAGMSFSAEQIGLPTTGATIISAAGIAATTAGNNNGEFCKVLGAIHPIDYTAPDINFEVNLPANWNYKALHFGGGGLNGTVVTGLGHYVKQPSSEATPLARGYVTYGSDSGHKSAGGFDGNFYLNREALENFGHKQLKKTHDVAMLLVQALYGQAPQYSYFAGGSQGGHEGFDVVQRFPEDYDGVLAGYPAHNVIMLHLSALNYARALYAHEERSWLSPAKVSTLVSHVYGLCDGLDGVEDGVISNVAGCRGVNTVFKGYTAQNPLRCPNGADTGNECLSDPQLEALNIIDTEYEAGFSIFNDDTGSAVFPKWTPFEGSTFMDGGSANLGAEGPAQALQRSPAVATNGLAVAQDLTLDVIADFDPLQYAGKIIELASVMSANSLRLDRFRDKGGKLIFFHGTVDDYISPYSSVQYYNRLLTKYGQAGTDDFVRFYTVAGMGHVSGVFNARLSGLDALEAWVEQGIAPTQLQAIDINEQTIGRTRPVCLYPGWPRYNGSGDINKAESFSCAY